MHKGPSAMHTIGRCAQGSFLSAILHGVAHRLGVQVPIEGIVHSTSRCQNTLSTIQTMFFAFYNFKQVSGIFELSSSYSIHHFEVGFLFQNSDPNSLKHIPLPILYTLIPSNTILKPYLLNIPYQIKIPSLSLSYYIYSILQRTSSYPLPYPRSP